MLAELDDALADAELGVPDAARRRRVPLDELGVEDATVEIDGGVGVADDQVRPNGAQVGPFVGDPVDIARL